MSTFRAAAVAALMLVASPVVAGIVDTPVPQGFKLVYSVPAISGTLMPPNARPVFTCTNTHKSEITVAVEVFSSAGVSGGSFETSRIPIPVGATVNWSMGGIPFGTVIDRPIGIAFGNGKMSARIVATSANVMCVAYLVNYDDGKALINLTIVAKTKQKAAN